MPSPYLENARDRIEVMRQLNAKAAVVIPDEDLPVSQRYGIIEYLLLGGSIAIVTGGLLAIRAWLG